MGEGTAGDAFRLFSESSGKLIASFIQEGCVRFSLSHRMGEGWGEGDFALIQTTADYSAMLGFSGGRGGGAPASSARETR